MTSSLSKILLLLFSLAISLVIGEGILRLFGMEPHQIKVPVIVSEPGVCMSPHSQLGLVLNPGKFQVTINEALKYQCNHREDGTRATQPENLLQQPNTKKVFFFGCSLTYGMGLTDSLTFPFLVQKQFPKWKVYNFAVPAYGTLQSYLQLKSQIRKGNLPQLVVLNYTSLHDSRNKLSLSQQKYWQEAFSADTNANSNFSSLARFPYLTAIPDKSLNIQYLPISHMKKRWKWSHHSTVVKIMEIVFDNILDGFVDKQQISQKIILEFLATCRQNEIPLIITGISNDQDTKAMLAFCQDQQIDNLGLDHDLLDKQYNLYPHDSHPNATAHQIFAQKLIHFLKQGSY